MNELVITVTLDQASGVVLSLPDEDFFYPSLLRGAIKELSVSAPEKKVAREEKVQAALSRIASGR